MPAGIRGEHRILGGHPHHGRDAPLRHELKHAGRLERTLEHDRRPHPPRQQRLAVPRGDMKLRQHRQHDVAARQRQGTGKRHVVPEAVGVGEHDTLGRCLRTGREDHKERIVVADRAFRAGPPGSRQVRLDRAGTEQDHGGGLGDGAERFVGQDDVLVVDEEQIGVAATQEPADLARGEPPRQGHERDTGQRASEERHDMIGGVARDRRDAIPGSVPGAAQRRGQRGGPARKRGVVDGHAAVVDGDRVRRLRGAVGHPAADRVDAGGLDRCRRAHARTSTGFSACVAASSISSSGLSS